VDSFRTQPLYFEERNQVCMKFGRVGSRAGLGIFETRKYLTLVGVLTPYFLFIANKRAVLAAIDIHQFRTL